MQNHSTRAANKIKQDVIELLVTIRNITHNMKERKHRKIALVECLGDLYTTVRKPN